MSKKKTTLISLLVIVSLAIIIVVLVTPALTPFFQPRSDLPPEIDEEDETRIDTNNDSSSNQTAATNSTTTTTTIMPTTIDIVSTTSAFPFVQRWAAQYENQLSASSSSVNVDYLADREIIVADGGSGRSDLAIVGVPDETNNSLDVPVSAQAVAIVYNIPSFPDIPSGLRLNSTMLFLILNGNITWWDDAAIKDLNPTLNLPHERIVVVHSDDDDDNGNSSSSQVLLNQYLGLQSISWPKNDSIVASGPAELAEMVRKIPYSVGYVDFSYAIQTRMTYAAIGDADGDYIVPSTQSIGRAVDVALQFHNSSTDRSSSQQQEHPPPTINVSRIVSGSYPIVGLYYASLLANHDSDKEEEGRSRNAVMLDFVEWIISENGGQQTLLEVQYPPIYSDNEQLATYAEIIVDTMRKSLSN
ncbi:MAG: substrate-binding domain-containing protein [Thermoproteota archaeon]|nr:substrate-binding domain-containing protein [Thermoproteota archaeon]